VISIPTSEEPDILKSIEAQHGLLVERSRGIYSFSHLTFHEYFTARQFKEKADGYFIDLVNHVTKYADHERKLNFTRNLTSSLASALNLTNNFARVRTVESIELLGWLKYIKDKLPDISSENLENFPQWWEINGQNWMRELIKIEIEHRNIGHEWKFNNPQKILLRQYYDANKLLVDCLNSDCYVSREVRAEIESTLLLPISSIEKLKSGK
jgi:predicted NACHT family NTPase